MLRQTRDAESCVSAQMAVERHHLVSQSVRLRMAWQLRTAVERGDFQDVALLHEALATCPMHGVRRVLDPVLSAVRAGPSEVLRQVHSLGTQLARQVCESSGVRKASESAVARCGPLLTWRCGATG